MKYLLDTSTLVHVLRRRRDERVAAHLKRLEPGDAAICPIVRIELGIGASKQPNPAAALSDLHRFLADFPSLPFDDAAADRGTVIAADLARRGTPIGPYDLLIAGIALAHNLTLVTGNTGEFRRVSGLRVEDWSAV